MVISGWLILRAYIMGNLIGDWIERQVVHAKFKKVLKVTPNVNAKTLFAVLSAQGKVPNGVALFTTSDLRQMKIKLHKRLQSTRIPFKELKLYGVKSSTMAYNMFGKSFLEDLEETVSGGLNACAVSFEPKTNDTPRHVEIRAMIMKYLDKKIDVILPRKFIVTDDMVQPDVLGHEIGHTIDWELHKDEEGRSSLDREISAWDLSPVRTENTEKLRSVALSSYSVGRVGAVAGAAAAVSAVLYALTTKSK